MKSNYLQAGKRPVQIGNILACMSFEDHVSLAEQAAREAAANERLTAIEAVEAQMKTDDLAYQQEVLLVLGRPGYKTFAGAREKVAEDLHYQMRQLNVYGHITLTPEQEQAALTVLDGNEHYLPLVQDYQRLRKHGRLLLEKGKDDDMALTDVLQVLIDTAQATGKDCEKTLTGGLRIHLRPEEDGSGFLLTIWREGVNPSAQEWNTVVAYWPYDLGGLNWSNAGRTSRGKFFKQARIPNE